MHRTGIALALGLVLATPLNVLSDSRRGGHGHDHGHHHGHDHGHHDGHGHDWHGHDWHGGHGHGGYHWGGSGYGASFGFSFGGLNYYHGPAYGAPFVPDYGYYGYDPGYYSLAPAPQVYEYRSPIDPYANPALRESLEDEVLRWGNDQLQSRLTPDPVTRLVTPSTNEAKLRSVRFQGQGDVRFLAQDYAQAYARYKSAVDAAEDRAEAHFRLGMASAAMNRYSTAVQEFKRGLHLDPSWPVTGETLTELFGPDNVLAKNSVLHKVGEWVRQDIRDPDRLFLLGVLLHFDRHDGSREVFATAWRLAGRGDHLQAFLTPIADAAPESEPLTPIPARQPNAAAPAAPAPAPAPSTPRDEGDDELPPLPPAGAPAAGSQPAPAATNPSSAGARSQTGVTFDGPQFPVLPGS